MGRNPVFIISAVFLLSCGTFATANAGPFGAPSYFSPKILIEQKTASPLVIQVKDKKGGSKSSKSGSSKSIPRKQITKKKDAGIASFMPGGAAVSAAVGSTKGAVGGTNGGPSLSGSN